MDAPPFQEDYTVFVHVVDDDGRMIGEIQLGEAVVDDFDLEPGAPLLRRTALGQSQMGLAALQSNDTRQLGVRVFRAFVQPKQ